MKIKDIQNLNVEELVTKEKELKKEIFQLNAQRQLGKIEKPAKINHMKKDVARILTVLNERKQNGK